ncbi:MAG: FkbM family methyltransferase [Pseudomonadota bacterium]
MDRIPSTEDSLRALLGRGLRIETVIDVGVHHATQKLMRALPDAFHLLLEPTKEHADAIRANYADFRYDLQQVAVGDKDDDIWIVNLDIVGKGDVTHSRVVATEAEAKSVANQLENYAVPLRKLDTIMAATDYTGPYLVKIDVDGFELQVLEGAKETLSRAAAVCIEAPRTALSERLTWLENAGYHLIDIVDIDYYQDTLWQVDLILVHKDVLRDTPALAPTIGPGEFDAKAYRSLRLPKKRFWSRNRR